MAQQQCEKVSCQVIAVSCERASNATSSSKHGECEGMPVGNLEQLSIIIWMDVTVFNYYKCSLCLIRIFFSKVYLSIVFKVSAGEARFFEPHCSLLKILFCYLLIQGFISFCGYLISIQMARSKYTLNSY